jgi:hypothetical protein
MKKIWLLLLIPFILNKSNAQVFCDSIFNLCDSVSIDSVFILHSNDFDWLGFELTVNHHFLYAPTFVICPSTENVQFVDDNFGFFGIFGPASVGLHYVFQDFIFSIGSEISGKIVVDNSNSINNNCQIPFSITVNELTETTDAHLENSVDIFPNPAKDLLVVNLQNENDRILSIQLFNLAGIQQNISFTDNSIDLTGLIPGYYTVHIKLSSGKGIIQKIIKE